MADRINGSRYNLRGCLHGGGKILEGGISVRVLPKCRRFEKQIKMPANKNIQFRPFC